MKVARFTESGRTRLGIVDGDDVVDVGHADPSLPTTSEPCSRSAGSTRVADLRVERAAASRSPTCALEAPIALPPTFLAIGLNYGDHVAESGMHEARHADRVQQADHVRHRPVDPIEVPDRRARLGRLRGRARCRDRQRCRNVRPPTRADVVAGYLVVNDVSVRDWQRATPTMTMGKSWDTHGPIGPWLVTADEIPDPHDLRIRTWVDDDLRQDATPSR